LSDELSGLGTTILRQTQVNLSIKNNSAHDELPVQHEHLSDANNKMTQTTENMNIYLMQTMENMNNNLAHDELCNPIQTTCTSKLKRPIKTAFVSSEWQ